MVVDSPLRGGHRSAHPDAYGVGACAIHSVAHGGQPMIRIALTSTSGLARSTPASRLVSAQCWLGARTAR